MKKLLILLLCILLISGCSAQSKINTDAIYKEAYDAGYAAGQAAAQISSPQDTIAPIAEPTVTPELEEDNTMASRKNHAKLGDQVSITINSFSGKGELALSLTEIVSGDAAWEKMQKANMFNEEPGEGKQYILGKFTVTFVKDTSGADTPLELSVYNFSYVTGDYSVEDLPSVVCPEPEFSAKLFEGASSEGWVCFLADTDDPSPMALFTDNIWFSLAA